MKKNLENNSTDWLYDLELKKILKIDDFKVSELILNFDLIAYDTEGNIKHFYGKVPSELVLEIGSLKFKRKDVDEFIKNNPDLGKSEPRKPESYRERLENRLRNIIYLEQIRDQQFLPPTSYLKQHKSIIKEQIKDSERAVIQNGLPEDAINLIKRAKSEIETVYIAIKKRVGFSGYTSNAEYKWQKAALDEFKKNENKFEIIAKDHLLDRNLYSLSSTNAKRDFIGFLLQKIVNTQFGKIGKDKLYVVFKKLK